MASIYSRAPKDHKFDISDSDKRKMAWKKALKRLEKEAVANGYFQWKEFTIDGKKYRKRMGLCPDCRKYKHLTPDHLVKRSLGGGHESSNIQWVCWKCHDKRDNFGDPMNKKPANPNNIKSWKTRHKCKHCKKWTIGLLCPFCGRISL